MFNNKNIQIIRKISYLIAFSVTTIRVNADNTSITSQGSIVSSNCMNNCVYSQTPVTGNNQQNIADSMQSSQRFISGTQPNGSPCPLFQSILIDTKTRLMWVQSPLMRVMIG